MKLENKVALITGGYGDLGAGIIKTFIREGAKIAFCGRNQEKIDIATKLYTSLGGDVLGIACDVACSSEVKEMFEKIVNHFGTLDILVNNAGVARTAPDDRDNFLKLTTEPHAKFSLKITQNMTDEEWLESININLNSVFYCSREALKIMEPNGYGKIINVASIAGLSNKSAHSPNYSTAKGGIVAFTRSLALEVAGAGIIVNAIAPGAIATEFWANMSEGNDTLDKLLIPIPVKRMGTIEEHASLVVYLASEEANYIVGQIISANGGMF